MMKEAYYLIYQEVGDEECSLTIQPFLDEDKLADTIHRLENAHINDYTIIRGKKMKAALRVAIDLEEDDID